MVPQGHKTKQITPKSAALSSISIVETGKMISVVWVGCLPLLCCFSFLQRNLLDFHFVPPRISMLINLLLS